MDKQIECQTQYKRRKLYSKSSIIVNIVEDEQMVQDYFYIDQQHQQAHYQHLSASLQNPSTDQKHPLINQQSTQSNINKKEQNLSTNNYISKDEDIQIQFQNNKYQDNSQKLAQQTKEMVITQKSKQKNENINEKSKQNFELNRDLNKNSNQQSNLQKNSHIQPHSVTRLQLEKQRHTLIFQEVLGQIYISRVLAILIGPKKQQQGCILLTNYRMIFFKYLQIKKNQITKKKRIDLPFGFVKNVQYSFKRRQVIFHLHYSHHWRFNINEKQNFQQLKIMIEVYVKNSNILKSFAFAYANKYKALQLQTDQLSSKGSQYVKVQKFDILKQYKRLLLPQISLIFPNDKFSTSYPQYICLPKDYCESSPEQILKIANNFKGNRMPIISYRYKQHNNSKFQAFIWVAGIFNDDNINRLNIPDIKVYYTQMKGNNKLHVFQCYFKSPKSYFQSSFDHEITNHFMNLADNSKIKSSYNSIVQTFLTPDQKFYTGILSSKWYDLIFQLMDKSFFIAQKIMQFQNVLIKEDENIDKTPQISALVQIIIDPYFRTFKGFKNLIMKQFLFFGHHFASRLGNRNCEDQCPIFVQFLDSVSQLTHLNPLSFQFNSKYLSKISNLMYTNIFGTFIADSPQQIYENEIMEKTVQIWNQIQNQLTTNAFYQLKSGILVKAYSVSDFKLWSQHFSYMSGQPRDIYKIHPLAQTNIDYPNLQCLKLRSENRSLKQQIDKQKHQIKRLRQQILIKKSKN